jgi:CubicO group peptidase (beta-lactamase class C family)
MGGAVGNGRALALAGSSIGCRESFSGRTARSLDGHQRELAAFIEEARRATDVPGVAIGVVQDGRPVFEQGFGVKDRASATTAGAVEPATLFTISR